MAPALRAFLEARVESGDFPGAAWWVGPAAAGSAWSSGAVGFAALEPEREPVDEETPFDLASLTKPLVTGLLLVLVEQERGIDLDAALARYLPETAGSPIGEVSLAALARHTSGLPAWKPLFAVAGTAKEYVAAIARQPLERAGRAVYSDLGYILLGSVLERVCGEGLDRSFARRIAGPLGLERTSFVVAGRDYSDAAATERGNRYERALAGPEGEGYAFRTQMLRGEVHDANADRLGGVAGHAGLFGPVAEVAEVAREVLVPRRIALGERARRLLLDTGGRGSEHRLAGGLVRSGRPRNPSRRGPGPHGLHGYLALAGPGSRSRDGAAHEPGPSRGTRRRVRRGPCRIPPCGLPAGAVTAPGADAP